MDDEKKSVVVYTDWGNLFDQLTDDEAGKLIKHFFSFVRGIDNPAPDKLTQIAFEQMKQQLIRDRIKWEEIKEKRSLAGKKSAAVKKENQQSVTKSTSVESVEKNSTESTVNGNVTVTVNGNVTEDILLEKESKGNSDENSIVEPPHQNTEEKEKSSAQKENSVEFRRKLIEYGFKVDLVDEWMLIRKKRKGINTGRAYSDFISEIEKCKDPPNDIMAVIVKRQWRGFEARYMDNIKNINTNGSSKQKSEAQPWRR